MRMRSWMLVAMFFSLMFLGGCFGEPGEEKEPEVLPPSVEQRTIGDYYPFTADVHKEYVGYGNEFAEFRTHTDYILENQVQERVENPGTTVARVLERSGGTLRLLYARGEAYYREDYLRNPGLRFEGRGEDILLMEPLVKGTTWTSMEGFRREITGVDVMVTVPYGTHPCLEVTTFRTGGDRDVEWYAEGIGLLKRSFFTGGEEISSSLKSLTQGVKLEQRVAFYFPQLDLGTYLKVEKVLSFGTNEVTRTVLQKAYLEAYDSLVAAAGAGPVLTQGTRINSLYRNGAGAVRLDLNQAFLAEMNAGSAYEGMILQALVRTFGEYYGTDRLGLTIDGGPYESGHFYFPVGEYLSISQ